MRISADMNLDQLAEHIWVNGDHEDPAITERMRALLVKHAPAYEWEKTSDIEDTDWFRMLHEAAGDDE